MVNEIVVVPRNSENDSELLNLMQNKGEIAMGWKTAPVVAVSIWNIVFELESVDKTGPPSPIPRDARAPGIIIESAKQQYINIIADINRICL